MRKELLYFRVGMRLNAQDHIGEICVWVDRIFLARCDECVEDREIFAGLFVPDEEEIGTPEGNATEAGFGGVVVGWNRCEAKKTAERFAMTEKIVRRFAHRRARLERVAVATSPAKKTSKQGTRALFTQPEMRGRPDDSGILCIAFDEVEMAAIRSSASFVSPCSRASKTRRRACARHPARVRPSTPVTALYPAC